MRLRPETDPSRRLLRSDDLVGDRVLAVQPRDDLAGAGVIESSVPIAQAALVVLQPFEADILQDQEILADEGGEGLPENGDGRAAKGLAIRITVAQAVAVRQRERGDTGKGRLERRIYGVGDQMVRVRGGSTGEGTKVEEAGHPLPVVDRVVVPEEWTPAELCRHTLEVGGRDLPGADLLPRPEDMDRGIEELAERFEVAVGSVAEDAVENGIVRVVAGADDDPVAGEPRRDPVDDAGLALREVGQVAAHVVEEDADVTNAEIREEFELPGQIVAGRIVEIQVKFVGREPDPEADVQVRAVRREPAQIGHARLRVGLAPPASKERIRFRGIEVERISMGREERDCLLTFQRGPWPPVESLDDTEFDLHIPAPFPFHRDRMPRVRHWNSRALKETGHALALKGAGRGVAGGLATVLVALTTACAQEPGPGADVGTTGGGATVADAGEFVASVSGTVYYWVGCDNWRSIPPENRLTFATIADAEDAGYRPSTARGCEAPALRAGPTPVETGSCTVTRVVDGDTLVCAEAAARIRLLQIDAPELAQGAASAEARAALERLLPVGSVARVELDVRERDPNGRILAYLHTQTGTFVNEELARNGFVTALVIPPNVRHEGRIRAAVEEARGAGRGLWASGAFDCAPADYRAGRCGQ